MFNSPFDGKIPLSYDEIANKAYSAYKCLLPITGTMYRSVQGKELFQSSKIEEICESYIEAYIKGFSMHDIENKWRVVLAIRLLFARDYFLSRHHHEPKRDWYSENRLVSLIVLALTTRWREYGFDWLVCHRAGLPIPWSCPSWELCESSRWAMQEYGESSSWRYEPGALSIDNRALDLEGIKTLITKCNDRITRGDKHLEDEQSVDFYKQDVQDAGDLEGELVIAFDFYWLMKDGAFTPRSFFRSCRLAKRLKFAFDFVETMQQLDPVSEREAYATICYIVSVKWNEMGESWLECGGLPDGNNVYWCEYKYENFMAELKDIFELNPMHDLVYFWRKSVSGRRLYHS